MAKRKIIPPLFWIICPQTMAQHRVSLAEIASIYTELPSPLRSRIMLVYRDKRSPTAQVFSELTWLRNHIPAPEKYLLCYGQLKWVKDLQLAGYHLSDGECIQSARALLGGDYLLGISRHQQTLQGNEGHLGADYVFLSPVFQPRSKISPSLPLGLDLFSNLAEKADAGVIALGGITSQNIGKFENTNALGCAFLGSVYEPRSINKELKAMAANWRKSGGSLQPPIAEDPHKIGADGRMHETHPRPLPGKR